MPWETFSSGQVCSLITPNVPSTGQPTPFLQESRNDTDVAHYNFNAHQPILVIFGRDVEEGYVIEW